VSDLFEDLDGRRPAGEDQGTDALIRTVLDLVLTAKTMPLSSSVLVSRDEMVDLLQAALDRMPDELRQARWLLKEREQFIAERAREADALLDEVKVQAERMVQRTEIVRQANLVAQRILDDANEEARRLRHEAEDYADQKLANFEIVLDRTMKTVQAGREKLQATPPPPAGPGEPGDFFPAGAGAGVPGTGAGGGVPGTGLPGTGLPVDPGGAEHPGPGVPDGFFDQDLD